MEAWNAGKNNMGFGMNRYTWNTLKACTKVTEELGQECTVSILFNAHQEFCTHDD